MFVIWHAGKCTVLEFNDVKSEHSPDLWILGEAAANAVSY
jgi:hypothetical protein